MTAASVPNAIGTPAAIALTRLARASGITRRALRCSGGGNSGQAPTQVSNSGQTEPSPDDLVNDDIPF